MAWSFRKEIHTDAVGLEEHLFQLADVRVLQSLEDVDFPSKVAGLVLRVDAVQTYVAQIPPEFVCLDHLDGVPPVLFPVKRLHNGGKRALPEFVLQVIVLVQATVGWTACQMAIDEPSSVVQRGGLDA